MTNPRVVPVILSGGSGTRLWPLSRTDCPKQFIALAGTETMLQLTVERVADPYRFEPPVVVANPRHADLIEAQLGGRGVSPRLILEPHARNTAPAIALAALAAEPHHPLLVMPSDHVIREPEAFRTAVEMALPYASRGGLVTFGIRPSRPETAYGYIRRGREIEPGLFEGIEFVEKPDRAGAERYLSEGCYDWNAGIFLFRADAYLEALAAHAPDILAAAEASMASATVEGECLYPDAQSFARSPSISIDYAVMEKAERFAVVPVEMSWSDVGSWDALHEISAQDGAGNAVIGDVLAIDSSGCLLRSEGPKLVALGVDDLVVVATGNVVLVVPRAQSQRVKDAVEAVREAAGGASLGV
jgi:mannose-1-phosphate guanylyltransferase